MNIYDKLLAELENGQLDELQRSVFEALKSNPQGVTRGELVYRLFGYHPADLTGNVDDRKIRKAIEELRSRLVPIVSSSGRAGYRLDTSPEAVRSMIGEWASRRDHLQNLITAAAKFYEMPEFYTEPVNAVQIEMFSKDNSEEDVIDGETA